MFSWLKRKSVADIPRPPAVEPIYHWSDDDIPRYPPFMKGLPAVPPARLLETQQELIERIAGASVLPPEDFRRLFLPIIERFAAFVHLLPASQSHHHRGAGGLFRHSLEVAYWALQAADKVLLDTTGTPSQRREREPRWQFSVFVAALCHDAGKPVTDVIVTNRDRTQTWKPIREDLYAWAQRTSTQAYYLEWRDGRARQHTVLSSMIADRIIGAQALEWIGEAGTDLIVWLMESLTCNPSVTNRLHDLVVKADQTSVERDLRTLGVAMAGYDIGVPVERHLTDVMRRFVREGVWLVNEPGARLWNIGGHVYLVWPAAGEDLARQVREDGIPGIPRTPDGILDMLVERQIAFVREGAAPGDRLWKIAPACLAAKIPDIKLYAIRLRDEAMVSSVPIPPIEGRIIDDTATTESEQQPSTGDNGAPDVEQVAETRDGADARESTDAQATTVQPQPSAMLPAQAPTRAAKSGAKPSSSSPRLREGASPEGTANDIAIDGPVGEALKALMQDVAAGAKEWGRDAMLDEQGRLLLRWPDAFAGYGLTPKAILDELTAREWLWIDPLAPLKKVQEVTVGAESVKCIALTPSISRALTASKPAQVRRPSDQKPAVELGPQPAPTSAPVREQAAPKPKKAHHPVAHEAATPTTTNAPPDSAHPATAPTVSADAQRNLGSEAAEAPTQNDADTKQMEEASLDDLISVIISEVQAEVLPDGSVQAPRQLVLAACKRRGLRITHRRLMVLIEESQGRLWMDGLTLRVRP
jgi:conjugal transfer pilus assembly protein TraI